MEWLHVDDNVTIIHHYTDSEIVHMVVSLTAGGQPPKVSREAYRRHG